MSLLELPAFATAAPTLLEAALKLRTSESSVTIAASLDEPGIFASALLEASLLDAGIPYQRRLRDNPQAAKGPSIVINSTPVSELESIGTDPLNIHLAPLEVCLLYTSPSPRDATLSGMASCA